MGQTTRPLEGVKVVELATMVAAPVASRYLADMGARVIKIEAPSGDALRYGSGNEGRPDDPLENMTFDLENANKKGIVLNIRDSKGKEILHELLSDADIFITNWRPGALKRQNLAYEDLKEQYPSLVYALLTGYGETGPECGLPGFDSTSFFARGGWSGTLLQKGTVPPNWTPGLGDHQAGMVFVAGILTALYRAKTTGEGSKVSVSLLHTSIFMQALMLQASQYGDEFGGQPYPMDRRDSANPLFCAAETSDGRFIQICCPVYDTSFEKVMNAIGRTDLLDDPVLSHISVMQKEGRTGEMFDIFQEAMAQKTAAEWEEILTEADIAHAVCRTWDEVLNDQQAWATDCFYPMSYPRGEKAMVRVPVSFYDEDLPPYEKAPLLGEHTSSVLSQLGYDNEAIDQLIAEGVVVQGQKRPA